MPARPYVANVVKIAVEGTIGSHNFAIILHSQYSGSVPTAAELNTAATAMSALWTSGLKPYFSSTVVLSNIVITDLSSATGAQGVWGGTIAGTNAGAATGGNTAILVNYPSSIRYRGGHPRTYLPCPPDNNLATPSTLSAGAITEYTTGWNAFLAYLFGTSLGTTTLAGQCAVSYVTDKAPRVTPLVMPIAQNAITVEAGLASQRRRIGRK